MNDTPAIRKLYREAAETKSDINQHVPTLRAMASLCKTVTEFGVRKGVSTTAFMAGLPVGGKLTSYDTKPIPRQLEALATAAEIEFVPMQKSTITGPPIAKTDLLFIDTVHTFEQVANELLIHGHRAKWIVFHDTVAFPKILPAITNFLDLSYWEIAFHHTFNNGLMAIHRVDGPHIPMEWDE